MKRDFKQWLSSIHSISTKQTDIYHLKSLDTKKTMTNANENPGPGMGQAQIHGRAKIIGLDFPQYKYKQQ